MRSKNAQMAAQFRHHFGLPVKSFPDIAGVDLDLHEKLLAEELEEFIEAADDRDPVELLDALADLVYVAYGVALECGFDLDAAFAEVHRSNMSKLLTEDEARQLGMQLLDVAGITPEMIEAFRAAWLAADGRKEKGQRIRAGLTAVMRTNTTASE